MVANNVPSIWDNPDARALLRKLWIDGMPVREMAGRVSRLLGFVVTHNAVIGKVHRLGLHKQFPRGNCGGAEAQRVTGAIKSRAKQVSRAAKIKKLCVAPEAVIFADVSNARSWLERERGQCAFPLGDRGAVMSCCAPTDETYCPAHRKAVSGGRKPWSGKDHGHPQGHPQQQGDRALSERFTGSEAA